MFRGKFLKILGFLFLASLGRVPELFAEPAPAAAAPTNPYFTEFFSEKVLTVTREGDGILPGTLRTALIQASGFRGQNSFVLVRIVFDPTVKRVRVTKGPLPEIDGSLTTLDCQNSVGRGLIEGAIEDTEGLDPGEEIAGLKITSNGNTVRNCHLTGFQGSGILIRGNRNVVEYNTLGYHKDVPETAVPPSPLFDEPKTNKGAGVALGAGASDNQVQNNEIIANTFNGVELTQAVGKGNKVTYNLFSKNSGKPIKVVPNGQAGRTPQITKITKDGERYIISGLADPKSEVQLYVLGKEDSEIGMNLVNGVPTTQEGFSIETTNKRFVANQTRLVALSYNSEGNSSEFSTPIVIPGNIPASAVVIGSADTDHAPATPSSGSPASASSSAVTSAPGGDPQTIEVDIPDTDHSTPAEEAAKPAPVSQAPAPAAAPAESKPETSLNVKGVGEKGGEPDSGGTSKTNEVSSLGI